MPVKTGNTQHNIIVHVHHHEKDEDESVVRSHEIVAEGDCSHEDEEAVQHLDAILELEEDERRMMQEQKKFSFI